MPERMIPVDQLTARRIRRFHAKYQERLGRKIPVAEAVAWIVQLAEQASGFRVTELAEPWRPPPREWFEQILADLPDPGVDTDSSKIDDLLYGEREGQEG